MKIVEIEKSNIHEPLSLIKKVFLEYTAPTYSKEGIETFETSVLKNDDYLKDLTFYGAFDDSNLLGVIATKNNGNHIAQFFVDGTYHNQGIGRKLFEKVIEKSTSEEITVNAFPYAVKIYHHLGFIDTDKEQTVDGIISTPMKYTKKAY